VAKNVADQGRFRQRFVPIDFPEMVSKWTKATLSDIGTYLSKIQSCRPFSSLKSV
jgi:hypothetical protein